MSNEISRRARGWLETPGHYKFMSEANNLVASLLTRVDELERKNESLKGNHFTVGISPLKHHQDVAEATRSAFERAAVICETLSFTDIGPTLGAKRQRQYCADAIRNEMGKPTINDVKHMKSWNGKTHDEMEKGE